MGRLLVISVLLTILTMVVSVLYQTTYFGNHIVLMIIIDLLLLPLAAKE